LKEHAREGAAAWTAVRADRQIAGRGRGGHQWVSLPGDLFLSFVVPAPEHRPLTLLPLLVGVAVAEAAAEWGVAARLKWPNDVWVGQGKLGGVLVESSSDGRTAPAIVAGVGLNLTLDPRHLPEGIRGQVTSVRALGVPAPSPDAAAAAVLARVAVWYHRFVAEGGADALREAWRELSVDWWGREVRAESSGALLSGIVRDLDERGALVLERPGGERVAVLSGEVRELRLTGRQA
jgi:BirA family biotin operon repressor/biotin-[acetyl-CoA-carboxylase] ligase